MRVKTCALVCPYSVLLPAGLAVPRFLTVGGGGLLPHRFSLTCAHLREPSAVYSLWRYP